ncbi:MAG: beta-propeller domain-containing protein [Spirulinaceae cyanobacterium]
MTRHKVLILDSNTADRTHLRQLLPNGNYEIAEATNGQEGLALIHQERGRIRFILIDADLPQINGWEIVAHLQADPSLDHIPLVIMVEAGDRTPPASTYPFLELLTKPFNRQQLKQVVKSAIQKAKAAPTAMPAAVAPAAPASTPSQPAVGDLPEHPSSLQDLPPQYPTPQNPTLQRPADEDLWSGFHSPHALPEDFPEEFQHPPELPDFPLNASDGLEGMAAIGDDLEVYTTSDEDQAAVSGFLKTETDEAQSEASLPGSNPPTVNSPTSSPARPADDLADNLPSPHPAEPPISEAHSDTASTVEAQTGAQSPSAPDPSPTRGNRVAENIFALPIAGQFTEEGGVLSLMSGEMTDVAPEPELELPIVAAPTEAGVGLTVELADLESALPEGDPFLPDSAEVELVSPLELASQLEDVDAQLAELKQAQTPEPADLWGEPVIESDVTDDDLTQVADFEFDSAFATPTPPEPDPSEDVSNRDVATSALEPDPFASFEADFAATDTPADLGLGFMPDEPEREAEQSLAVAPPMESAATPVAPEPFADFETDFESDFAASEAEELDVAALEIEELTIEELDIDNVELEDFGLDDPSPRPTPDLALDSAEDVDSFFELDAELAESPSEQPDQPETIAADPFVLDDLSPIAFTGTAVAGAAALASTALEQSEPESPEPESPELASGTQEVPESSETEASAPPHAEVLKPIAEIEFSPDDRPDPFEPDATLDTLAAEHPVDSPVEQIEAQPDAVFETPTSPDSEADPFAGLDLDDTPDWLSDPAFQLTPDTESSPAAESPEATSDLDAAGPAAFAANPEPTASTVDPFGADPLADLDADPFALEDTENTILGDKQPEPIPAVSSEGEHESTENTILGDNRQAQVAKDTDTSRLAQQLDAALTDETPEYTVLEDKREDGDVAGFAFEDPTKKSQRPLLQEGMVTLRGFEEVKMRFESAIASERIAAMQDAIAYEEPGYQLIFQALREEQGPVREAAEQIVSNRLRQSENAKPLTQQSWLKMDCLQVITGHSYWVQTVAIAADNRTLVTGSKDSTIKTWDLFSGQELRTIRGHDASVLSIALSADSKKIISSSTDNTIKIWNLETGEQLQVIKGDRHHKIYVVALSADDKTLISASAEQTAQPQFETDLEGLLSYLPSKSGSPLLGVVSFFRRSREIKLWDVRSGKVQGSLLGYSKGVTDLAVTPKGDQVVSGSRDHTVKVWDLQTKRTLNTLWGHTDEIRSVAISPDGKAIVSGSRDKTIKIWDLRTGHVLRTLRGHSQSVTTVAISPDGKTIVSGSRDATVKIWDFETGEYLNTLMGHTDLIRSVAISPDGQTIASGSRDNTVRVWRSLV